MKVLKTVHIPVDTAISELKKSDPLYIEVEGVRVNLYEVAGSIISNMIVQLDDAEEDKRRLRKVIADLVQCPEDEDYDSYMDTAFQSYCKPMAKHNEEFPIAAVIAALVK